MHLLPGGGGGGALTNIGYTGMCQPAGFSFSCPNSRTMGIHFGLGLLDRVSFLLRKSQNES